MKKKNLDYGWIIKICIVAFVISILFSFVSEVTITNINLFFGIILALVFIAIGILFDMIGISVAASDEAKFHSMATQKIKGAKTAVKLKRNAEKVSSFCNDVVGDICGIISGSAGAVIAIKISLILGKDTFFITLIIMGLISTFTIGGKALFKGLALHKSNEILFKFARFLSIFRGE